jgi:hypothetical protein
LSLDSSQLLLCINASEFNLDFSIALLSETVVRDFDFEERGVFGASSLGPTLQSMLAKF